MGLDVREKKCVVVGGGVVGSRKVTNLVRAGAKVTVISPDVVDSLAGEIEAGTVLWIQDSYRAEYLEGAFAVVAATDDEALNAHIVQNATDRQILICDASAAERSNLIFGALHTLEDGVTIAVFTDGRDPAKARRSRDLIANLLDAGGMQGGKSEFG